MPHESEHGLIWWWRCKRFAWATLKSDLKNRPPAIGDPLLGRTREERNRNMAERREAQAPKPEAFGLPPDYLRRYFVGGKPRQAGDPAWPPPEWKS